MTPSPRRPRATSALVVAAGLALAPSARAELPPVPIVTGAVTVTAVFADSVRPSMPAAVRLEIRQGAACWEAATMPWGLHSTDEAIAHLKRVIGWKSGYLFVRTECGGGNAWKCEQELVFAKRGGNIRPLARLAPRADGIGTSLRNGRFHDYDVDWEINDVTSHAGAPAFPLVMRDDGEAMVVDPEASWKEAETGYRRNLGAVAALRDSAASPAVQITRRDLLFGNAVVAAYFRRPADLVAAMEEARRTLDPETVLRIQRVVDGVHPGALPRTSHADLRLCGDGEE